MKVKSLFFALVISYGVWACHDRAKPEQPAGANNTGMLKTAEQALQAHVMSGQPVREPSVTEVDSLSTLQQQIMQQPDNAALRRELGRRAIDAGASVVWTVGKGRINPNATPANVAINQAKMAAAIDAGRWAAYLLEWHKTDYATNYGEIQAYIPGVKIVREAFNDSLCVVLVQVPLK